MIFDEVMGDECYVALAHCIGRYIFMIYFSICFRDLDFKSLMYVWWFLMNRDIRHMLIFGRTWTECELTRVEHVKSSIRFVKFVKLNGQKIGFELEFGRLSNRTYRAWTRTNSSELNKPFGSFIPCLSYKYPFSPWN